MAQYTSSISGASGDSTSWSLQNPSEGKGSSRLLAATGDFGGGTVTFYLSFDGGVTFPVAIPDAVFTDDGVINVDIASDIENPVKLRATLSGATGAVVNIFMYDWR